MPRYSIIVPVYNVEDYLRECLDSILAQDSPSEYEAILVDDGSTDNSGAICDEYAEKHPRFRVIHQENQGLSAARNSGLRAASGEFVLFFDSDDIWAQKLLSSMDDVVDDAADITLFPFEQFDEAGNTRVVRPSVMPCGESGEEYLRRLFDIGQMPPYSVTPAHNSRTQRVCDIERRDRQPCVPGILHFRAGVQALDAGVLKVYALVIVRHFRARCLLYNIHRADACAALVLKTSGNDPLHLRLEIVAGVLGVLPHILACRFLKVFVLLSGVSVYTVHSWHRRRRRTCEQGSILNRLSGIPLHESTAFLTELKK